jgi:hypothetical protein
MKIQNPIIQQIEMLFSDQNSPKSMISSRMTEHLLCDLCIIIKLKAQMRGLEGLILKSGLGRGRHRMVSSMTQNYAPNALIDPQEWEKISFHSQE